MTGGFCFFMALLNIIGKKFNHLIVIERTESKSHVDRAAWYKCICDCGIEIFAKGVEVKSGRRKSCGCQNWESKLKPFRGHYLYEVWHSMIQRCTNKNYHAYPHYGGRGICVFPDWFKYENFYNDVIDIYNKQFKERYHFDRIDNESNYAPGNVRFVSTKESARNKRGVVLTIEKANEIRNSKLSIKALAKKYGVKERAIYNIKANKTWV